MAAHIKVRKSQLVKALRASGGIISVAARSMGITRETASRCVSKWPELRAVIEEANEVTVDEAIVGLRELIADRNVAAIIFTLKTLGKARGYAQRYEVTGADGGPVQTADVMALTNEELAAIVGRPPAGSGGTGTA